MKFNLKQLFEYSPIVLSAIFTGVSFIIFFIFFLFIKPRFIKEISEKDKIYKINYYLLVSYSLMFSILIGIFTILYKVSGSYIHEKPKLKFDVHPVPHKKHNYNIYTPLTYT